MLYGEPNQGFFVVNVLPAFTHDALLLRNTFLAGNLATCLLNDDLDFYCVQKEDKLANLTLLEEILNVFTLSKSQLGRNEP